ncbi:MAG: D-alanyl-D-alanine carboxypeptidase family protein [Ahrensia sp.]|nr:D-alanyl-D-alanine carboxypeptidase family protein [Ahrensia sp.]
MLIKSFDRSLPFGIFSKFVMVASIAATLFAGIPASQAHAASKYAGIVIDTKTGKTLYSYEADEKRYPASLTKMMTLYMLFDAMKQGKVSKSTKIVVSKYAASMVPSKLGIKPGGSLTAEQAVYALVTKSANDVAAAVAEHLGRTETNFAVMMTQKARSIGMKSTTFKNASGLPNSLQVSTARDMARLGIALQEHFPREFKYFSTREFNYGRSRMANHNKLLGRVKGVDGIKTGYTRASGYNLVSSVNTDGRSIVGVVMGGKSGAARNAQMTQLIAQYLPKASRRGNGNLIAKAPVTTPQAETKAPIAVASVSTPNIPKPNVRPNEAAVEAPIVAYAPTPTPKVNIDPEITTASLKPRSGWVIQIGALDSQALSARLPARCTNQSEIGFGQA